MKKKIRWSLLLFRYTKILISFFYALSLYCSYFQDGLKTIEHFGSYVQDLSAGLARIRQKQEEERKQLNDLRQLLKSSTVFSSNEKEVNTRDDEI